jgi:hypothetical protein
VFGFIEFVSLAYGLTAFLYIPMFANENNDSLALVLSLAVGPLLSQLFLAEILTLISCQKLKFELGL